MALVRPFETVLGGKTTPLQHCFCVARHQSSPLLRLQFCYPQLLQFATSEAVVFFQPCKALNYESQLKLKTIGREHLTWQM